MDPVVVFFANVMLIAGLAAGIGTYITKCIQLGERRRRQEREIRKLEQEIDVYRNRVEQRIAATREYHGLEAVAPTRLPEPKTLTDEERRKENLKSWGL